MRSEAAERRQWRGRWRLCVGVWLAAALVLAGRAPATATTGLCCRHHRHRHDHRVYYRGPLYHAELLEDADSGRVLYEANGDLIWPPASMTKMMLLLVAEDQIGLGRFKLTDPVVISQRAASTKGDHLGLVPGATYPLGELMKAALIKSANDAAVAVAEKIAGSVENCVRMMNAKAHELGMTATIYSTVNGLPPEPLHDVDFTDPYDLATLGRALIHTTNLLEWSGMETAPFDGGVAMLRNTNHLVGRFPGCDGIKTGFTLKAGFNLTATAKRGDMRLIAVVLGAPSNGERFIQAAKLLDWGFDNFTKVSFLKPGEPLPVHVRVPSGQLVQPVAGGELGVVVRKDELPGLQVEYSVPGVYSGPLTSGAPMGQVVLRDSVGVLARVGALYPVSDPPTSSRLTVLKDPGASVPNGVYPGAAPPAPPP